MVGITTCITNVSISQNTTFRMLVNVPPSFASLRCRDHASTSRLYKENNAGNDLRARPTLKQLSQVVVYLFKMSVNFLLNAHINCMENWWISKTFGCRRRNIFRKGSWHSNLVRGTAMQWRTHRNHGTVACRRRWIPPLGWWSGSQ